MANDQEFLKEIRDELDRDTDFYADIRKEGETDMRYLANDPWDPAEKQARLDAGRPFLTMDNLNQYTNQVINDFLINKRDVEVKPGDMQSSDADALLIGDIIRQIHYDSKANDAHQCAVENAVQRSYGVWGLMTDYVSPDSFEQKIVVRRIPNPAAVYWDPDCKQADFSDMNHAFVLDTIRRKDFKKKYPGAEIHDFSSEHVNLAPKWIKDTDVQIAEFWQRKELQRELVMFIDPQTGQPTKIFTDELGDGAKVKKDRIIVPGGEIPILRDEAGNLLRRKSIEYRVTQYITNGIEILEENPWDGSWIPLFPVIGKEMYVDQGAGPKRMWFSLVRLGRDPQMLLNYYRTSQAEVVGMTPKTKWVMYEGQIEGHEDEWQNANRSPITALQVKPVMDATGQAVLPLPQRQDYNPPLEGLEIGAQSAEKAIQSALGMFNASVGRHDTNAKSGVAIKALDTQSDVGTFHFRASFDRALQQSGRCEEELLKKHYTTPRDVGARNAKGEHRVVRINEPFKNASGQIENFQIGGSRPMSVTIGVGPSYQSQHDKAEAFADLIAQQSPEIFAVIGDLLVKLKNLGPIGDEIAMRLTPPEYRTKDGQAPLPPQVQQQLAQAGKLIDELTARLNELTEERNGKILELQVKKDIATMQAELEKYKADLDNQAKLEKISSDENLSLMEQRLTQAFEQDRTALGAKIDLLSQGSAQAHAVELQKGGQEHEAGMQDREHGHQQELATQQAAAAAETAKMQIAAKPKPAAKPKAKKK